MSAFLDRHNEALSGYRDLPYFAPVEPPVCEAARIERDRLLAEAHADRQRRVAAGLLADRAERRRLCTTDHAREVREAAKRFAYVLAAAKTDGFLTPHAAEIKALMEREVRALQEQQENARG